jgi:putative endonuclease
MADWTVYIVESDRGALYTGITTSLERRLDEHGGRRGRGARFFRFGAPRRVVYTEGVADRSLALRREAQIKRLDRAAKLELIAAADRAPA